VLELVEYVKEGRIVDALPEMADEVHWVGQVH
jgi:hypothetical protein